MFPPQLATPVVGQQISAIGGTSGQRNGSISQINVNTPLHLSSQGVSVMMHNAIRANFRSAGGDSGGVAFSGTNFSNQSIQGIVVGGTENANITLISRASEILVHTGWRLN